MECQQAFDHCSIGLICLARHGGVSFVSTGAGLFVSMDSTVSIPIESIHMSHFGTRELLQFFNHTPWKTNVELKMVLFGK